MNLNESVNQAGALKFVFLAGGAGSGKNYVANKLFAIDHDVSFGASGMKMVSFDAIFEKVLEKHGYPSDFSQLDDDDRDKVMDENNPKSMYSIARKVMKKQLANHLKQGNGIIFDGTGRMVSGYLEKKEQAERLGYDTYLIFVDTPLETALERNAKRDRRLPDEDVARIYRAVKRNKSEFQRVFGKNMFVVENGEGAQIDTALQQKIDRVIGSYVQNPRGQFRIKHNGQLPPQQKPIQRADPLPEPLMHHANDDGSHSVFTPDGDADSQTVLQLGPGEVKTLQKQNAAAANAANAEMDKKREPSTWWNNFKAKQAEMAKKWFGKSGDTNLSNLVPGQERIYNPETGNDILVTTAMGYPPNHPMRIAAEKLMAKNKKE